LILILSLPLCLDAQESGTSESVVPCDTTHVKIEKPLHRSTDDLTTSSDDAAGAVPRHPGTMVSSSDAGLPPFVSIMPPTKRVRYFDCLQGGPKKVSYCIVSISSLNIDQFSQFFYQ